MVARMSLRVVFLSRDRIVRALNVIIHVVLFSLRYGISWHLSTGEISSAKKKRASQTFFTVQIDLILR